jgi:hypothetical protein
MPLLLELVHNLLRQLDTRLVGGGEQFDSRRYPFPGHRPGIGQHRLDRVEPGPIPMICYNAPAAFDGIVLAVIGRVRG